MKHVLIIASFKLNSAGWDPCCDAAPHGFQPGNIYCLPAEVADDVVKKRWGVVVDGYHEVVRPDSEEELKFEPVTVQPDDIYIRPFTTSP